MSSVAPATSAGRGPLWAVALVGLTLLTLINLQLFLGYPASLCVIPLALGGITLALALVAPWPLTVGLCAAWPLLIDIRRTARLALLTTGLRPHADHWLSSLPPYPALTMALSVAGLVWAWRTLLRSPRDEPLRPDSLRTLIWLWGAVILVGTVIGLASLNPILSGGLWETLVDRSWRWSMTADFDTLHPLAAGHAALMGLLFFAAIRSQMNSPQRQRTLMMALIAAGVGVALLGVLQFILHLPRHIPFENSTIEMLTWVRDSRVISLLRDPNSLGTFLTAALLLALPLGGGALTQREGGSQRGHFPLRRSLSVAVLAALAVALLMTGSRVAWGAAALMILAWVFGGWRRSASSETARRDHRAPLIAVFGFLWLIALIWPVLPPVADQPPPLFQQRLFDTLGLHADPSDTELREGLAGRQHHWAVAHSMILVKPLWGQGIGTFRLLYDSHRATDNALERQNAHSQPLQTWAESGLAGLAVLVLIIAFALVAGHGSHTAKLALVGFLLTSLTGHPLLLPEMQLVFWILIALAAPIGGRGEVESTELRSHRRVSWAMGTLVAVVLVSGAVSATAAALRSRDLPQRWGLYELFLSDTTGIPFVWTSGHARISLDVQEPLLALPLRAGHPDVGAEPVDVTLGVDGEPLRQITLRDTLWQMVTLDLRPWRGETVLLEIDLSRTWSPSTWGIPDHRDLGLALGPWEGIPEKLTPDPVSFEPWSLPSLHGEGAR
ncbi:O-antigen ligase family protein [Candidatus Sumerlaeota bacterium]|nr:O-antigen ligase family protein [Candidatus Sumerlaeota bacterium]